MEWRYGAGRGCTTSWVIAFLAWCACSLYGSDSLVNAELDGYSVGDTLHTSLDGSSVRILWHSENNSSLPECEYICSESSVELPRLVPAMTYTYPNGAGGFTGVLHEVLIRDVVPGRFPDFPSEQRWHLVYRCHNEPFAKWSDPSTLLLPGPQFRSRNDSAIALVADMGVDLSGDTMASLQKAHATHMFGDMTMLVHVGDISYADDRLPGHNWKIWKEFLTSLQPLASGILYMTGPGNHEAQFNFTAYHNWFHMPYERSNSFSPDYYSFDHLGIHFTMISTELDFSPSSLQYKWLVEDLRKANENRRRVPWLIVTGHRPLYCSSIMSRARCTVEAPLYRTFIEDLLFEQKVDVYLCGHNHQYERTYPMYQGKAVAFNFTNPQAPVYIVNGGAGNIEGNDHTHESHKAVPWRAAAGTFHTGWMSVVPSRDSLRFFYVESKKHQVVDQFEITRAKHD